MQVKSCCMFNPNARLPGSNGHDRICLTIEHASECVKVLKEMFRYATRPSAEGASQKPPVSGNGSRTQAGGRLSKTYREYLMTFFPGFNTTQPKTRTMYHWPGLNPKHISPATISRSSFRWEPPQKGEVDINPHQFAVHQGGATMIY